MDRMLPSEGSDAGSTPAESTLYRAFWGEGCHPKGGQPLVENAGSIPAERTITQSEWTQPFDKMGIFCNTVRASCLTNLKSGERENPKMN